MGSGWKSPYRVTLWPLDTGDVASTAEQLARILLNFN